jgi:glycine cleavage system H protein
MPKWRTIRLKPELVEIAKKTVETSRYRSLSEFVSEAIRLRLDELKQSHKKTAEKQAEYPLIHERLFYSPNHLWTIVTPEGNMKVGLSDYAQRHLGGIASVQIDPVGREVKKGEPFGVVKTWMFKFDLYSPISGKIIKINKAIQDKPSLINEDPYGIAWISEIKPNNLVTLEEELRDLMRLHQYKTWASKLSRRRILGT